MKLSKMNGKRVPQPGDNYVLLYEEGIYCMQHYDKSEYFYKNASFRGPTTFIVGENNTAKIRKITPKTTEGEEGAIKSVSGTTSISTPLAGKMAYTMSAMDHFARTHSTASFWVFQKNLRAFLSKIRSATNIKLDGEIGKFGYKKMTADNPNIVDEVNKLSKEADTYQNFINNYENPAFKTTTKKQEQIKLDNVDYYLIGPYKVTFSHAEIEEGKALSCEKIFGKLSSTSLTLNNKNVSFKVLEKSGSTFSEIEKTGIESGKAFYLAINKSSIDGSMTDNKATCKLKLSFKKLNARVEFYTISSWSAKQRWALITKTKRWYTSIDREINVIVTKKENTLTIIKEDRDTGAKLQGAKFTVKLIDATYTNNDNNNNKYYYYNTNTGKYGYRDSAYNFETNSAGKIVLKNLVQGKYEIIETKAPSGYILNSTARYIYVKDSGQAEVIVKNKKQPPPEIPHVEEPKYDLTIIKKDQDSGKKLEGAKFTVQLITPSSSSSTNKNKYVYYTDTTKKTCGYRASKYEFTTDSNGEIKLKDLEKGKYEIVETGVPSGYYTTFTKQSIELDDDKEITVNNRKLISVTGNIWLDKKRDNLYYKKNDAPIYGIHVSLVYKENNEYKYARFLDNKYVQNINDLSDADKKEVKAYVKADENGIYKMTNVPIEMFKNKEGYILFQRYDGITHSVVTKKINKDNGSKAIEISSDAQMNKVPESTDFTNRNTLNSKFKKIKSSSIYSYTTDSGTTRNSQLLNISKDLDIRYGPISKNQSKWDKGTLNFDEVEGENQEKLSVTCDYLRDTDNHNKQVLNKRIYSKILNSDIKEVIKEDVDGDNKNTISHMNLGLYEKTFADLEIANVIQDVTVNVNEYSQKYQYRNSDEDEEEDNSGAEDDNTSDGNEEGNNNGNNTEEEISETGNETSDETGGTEESETIEEKDDSLKWELTEKFKPVNYTEKQRIYTSDRNAETFNVKVVNKITIRNISDDYKLGVEQLSYWYNKGTITKIFIKGEDDDEVIYEKKDKDNYKVNTKNIIELSDKIILGPGEIKDVFVETTLNKDNIKIENITDKDEFTNIVEIASYTPYDKNSTSTVATFDKDSIPNNSIINNNGEIKTTSFEDDTAISKLEFEGKERSIKGTVFKDDFYNNTANGNGEFEENEGRIGGVKVSLCNQNGEEIKNTVTDSNGDYSLTELLPGNYLMKYTWGDKDHPVQTWKGTIYPNQDRKNNQYWYMTTSPRYTDAIDNYVERLAIDYEMKRDYQNVLTSENIKDIYENNNGKINKINSITPNMKFGIENIGEERVLKMGDSIPSYNIENIDFGLIERPKQEIALEKEISHIKITLPDERPVVDADTKAKRNDKGEILKDNNGNDLYEKVGNITNLKIAGDKIQIEIEDELIQGAQLEIQYKINLINKSQTDYEDEDYYKYGTIPSNPDEKKVKIRASKLIEFLDEKMEYTGDKWKKINNSEYKTKDTNEKDEHENSLYSYIIQINNENDTVTSSTKIDSDKRILYEAYNEGNNNFTSSSDKINLDFETSKSIQVSDKLNIKNNVEVMRVEKNENPDQHLGAPLEELPKAEAPEVIITPPTGKNKAFVQMYIIISSILCIVGLGIVTLKYKNKRNK